MTETIVVAGRPQLLFGVKVRATGPLCPCGLKIVPATLGPLQAPVGKAGSCKAVRLTPPSLVQTRAVPRLGAASGRMVMVVAPGPVQGAKGAKDRVTVPVRPAGEKEAPDTPGPLHVPVGKAGSCRAVSAKLASLSQTVALAS